MRVNPFARKKRKHVISYDASKDIEYFYKEVAVGSQMRLVVRVMKYGASEPKIHISRERLSERGEVFIKRLGRLTEREVDALMPMLSEAILVLKSLSKVLVERAALGLSAPPAPS